MPNALFHCLLFSGVLGVVCLGLEAQAQDTPPPELGVQFEQASQLFFQKEYTPAHEALSKLTRSPHASTLPSQVFLYKALIERERRAYNQSIKTFTQGLHRHPKDLALLLELAVTYSWSDRLDDALAMYDRARTQHPTHLGAKVGYARILSWQGHHEASLHLYNRVLQKEPNHIEALMGKAFVHRALLQRDAAATHYTHVLRLQPDHQEALKGLASLERIRTIKVYNQTGVVQQAEQRSLEVLTGIRWQATHRWSATFEHGINAGVARFGQVLLFDQEEVLQGTQRLALGAGRTFGAKQDLYLGVSGGRFLEFGRWRTELEASQRVLPNVAVVAVLAGGRVEWGEQGEVFLGRVGSSVGLGEWGSVTAQWFTAYVEILEQTNHALALQGALWLWPQRLQLGLSVAPGVTVDSHWSLVGGTGVSWWALNQALKLDVSLQMGQDRFRFFGVRTGVQYEF